MAAAAAALALAAQCHAAGDLSQAEQHCRSALGAEPNLAEAWRLLGVIAHARGEPGQALEYLNRALLCDRGNAETWKNLGDVRIAHRDYRGAVSSFEEALRLRPDYQEVYLNMGLACQHLGDLAGAAACCRVVIQMAPTCAEAYNNLGNALLGQGKLPDAAAAYEQALKLRPDHSRIAQNLGIALHQQGKHAQAVLYYREALRLDPEFIDASNNLAAALKELGQFDEAIAQFRETLKLDPHHALATYNLGELAASDRFCFSDDELQRLKMQLTSADCPPLDKSFFAFTLGTVLDNQGAYEEAFSYFQRANELRRRFQEARGLGFNAQKHEAYMRAVMDMYGRVFFERTKGWGLDTEVPVFIIGMPRSGSTLVEQILASHPCVFGAGEIEVVPRLSKNLAPEAHAQFYANPARTYKLVVEEIAARYLDFLQQISDSADRVTIKTLENYLHLGIIGAMFPQARIIHCRRDPLDVCLSCYFQNFREVAFAWSLEDISSAYRWYEKLMAHWSAVLPVPMHEVRYEDLIQNQEAVTRDLLAFCGLDWDDRCLNFFATRRPVTSASSIQVRKPMSARSIGRWQHYRAQLGPLLKALGRDV